MRETLFRKIGGALEGQVDFLFRLSVHENKFGGVYCYPVVQCGGLSGRDDDLPVFPDDPGADLVADFEELGLSPDRNLKKQNEALSGSFSRPLNSQGQVLEAFGSFTGAAETGLAGLVEGITGAEDWSTGSTAGAGAIKRPMRINPAARGPRNILSGYTPLGIM
jgi:hypothetical protein